MTPKADRRKDQYRKHCFAPIDVPAEDQAPPPLEDATFTCGLAAPPENRPARQQPDGAALQPEKADAGTPQDPVTPARIWEQFGGVLKELEKEKNQTFARAAAETLKLSLAISQKILNAPPGIDIEKTSDLVDKTWQSIEQEHIVHLKISPDDRKALKKAIPDAAGLNDTGAGYVFDEDPGLENGTCLVAGPRVDMQNSLHQQLPSIERNFTACCLKKPPYGQTAEHSRAHIPYKGRP